MLLGKYAGLPLDSRMGIAMKSLRIVLLVLLCSPFVTLAEDAKPGFERWEPEIAAIGKRDAEQKVAPGTTVFVGSSSIRLWNLKHSFPELATVNHGFGGSTIADVVHFVEPLVLKLEPKTIVFYSGDNDLGSKSAEQVHADFAALLKAIRARLPESKFVFVAIKPSPSRWKLFDKQKEANRLIQATLAKDEHAVFVDVVTAMLGNDGQPRAELFQKDQLHLNESGYALWNKLVLPELK